jgi:hypothetical protein
MEPLTTRALGRATLARQLLLARADLGVLEALTHLVGVQGQSPEVPYVALWARLAGFRTDDLAAAMADRTAVRTTLMRATIHAVTAADALALRPVMQPVVDRTLAGTAWGRRLREAGLDGAALAELDARARALVEARPLTRAGIQRALEADPAPLPGGVGAEDAATAVVHRLPLVHTTPRGIWGASAQATLTTYRAWLGRDPGPGTAAAVGDVVVRYLAAHGPATVRDVQAWCGLTRLREVVEGLGDRVRRLPGPDGAELWDVPDGVLPDPDTPAPVRFMAEYDNALLSFADRSRVIADLPHVFLPRGPGGYGGTVLVDGLVRATWAVRRAGRGADAPAALEVRESAPLRPAERDEVEAEGRALLAVVAPGAEHTVAITPTGVRGPGEEAWFVTRLAR